jgi:hypothetical protein
MARSSSHWSKVHERGCSTEHGVAQYRRICCLLVCVFLNMSSTPDSALAECCFDYLICRFLLRTSYALFPRPGCFLQISSGSPLPVRVSFPENCSVR